MFKQILEKVVTDCSGALGAVLMGFDGIAIDDYVVGDVDIDVNLVGIEYSNIAKEISRAADILNLGNMNELTIKSDQYYIILRVVTDEYFLGLIVASHGNFGKGRYLLQREAPGLRKEL